jgi:hypothetical protein
MIALGNFSSGSMSPNNPNNPNQSVIVKKSRANDDDFIDTPF